MAFTLRKNNFANNRQQTEAGLAALPLLLISTVLLLDPLQNVFCSP
jgi:hypothetical protein